MIYLLRCVREVVWAVWRTIARLRFDWGVGHRLGTVDFRRGGAATNTTHVFLGFGAVVSCIRLDCLMGTRGMVAGEVLELISLGVSDLRGIAEVVIDELFIGHVDQGTHVDGRDCDKGQAPEWNNLDEPVGEKSRDKASNGMNDILGKKNTLELNDEEVDELLDVLQRCFKSLPWNCVVLLGSEGGS